MRTRLEDLIATAEAQLAAQSYDAAVDTYRTAMGEPGAEEAGVAARLAAACQARDAARGVPAPEPPVEEPPVPMAAAPPEAPVETQGTPPEQPARSWRFRTVSPPAAPMETRVAPPEQAPPDPPAAPPPPAETDDRPIEPPAFQLIEDDPSMLERPRRRYEEPPEVEKLSILDPTPLPAVSPQQQGARLFLAALIFFAVCGMMFFASFRRNRPVPPPPPSATDGSAYPTANGNTLPQLQFKTEGEYTEEARRAKIQGTVVLAVTVEPDGTATVVRVVKSLDPGLDQNAIEAVRKWRFRPGTRDGQPVPVSATVEVNFRLL